jgi:hypothetical protein
MAAGGLPWSSIVKRVYSPIDHLTMQSVDNSQVAARIRAYDTCLVSWFLPTSILQQFCHPRYEVEPYAFTKEKGGIGILTLCGSRNTLLEKKTIDNFLEPKPQPSVSLRVSVVDRVHWQRSLWEIRSYAHSVRWARVPRWIYGIDIDDKTHIEIDTEFDEATKRYKKYELRIPTYDLNLKLEDTGVGVMDRSTPIVPGFLDNESAMKLLAMQTETNTRGEGGCIYRTPYWASPVHPNVAKMLPDSEVDTFLTMEVNSPTLGPPIAAWLVRDIPEIKLYQVEAHVEDENDPNSASHFGEKTLHGRIQTRVLNRHNAFRDELRAKVYSDIEGKEVPR